MIAVAGRCLHVAVSVGEIIAVLDKQGPVGSEVQENCSADAFLHSVAVIFHRFSQIVTNLCVTCRSVVCDVISQNK